MAEEVFIDKKLRRYACSPYVHRKCEVLGLYLESNILLEQQPLYKTNASNKPPTIVNTFVAAFAMAPFGVATAVEVAAGLLDRTVLPGRVATADRELMVEFALCVGVEDTVDDEVELELELEEELVYALPGASWTVVVAGAPVAEPLAELPPVMWKGKEYWKVVGAESRLILKP